MATLNVHTVYKLKDPVSKTSVLSMVMFARHPEGWLIIAICMR